MSAEITEVFEELLFGSGAWIGLIIILAIMLPLSVKLKYSSAIWIIVMIFLEIEYYNNISRSSNFMWAIIISLMAIAFFAYRLYEDVKH